MKFKTNLRSAFINYLTNGAKFRHHVCIYDYARFFPVLPK